MKKSGKLMCRYGLFIIAIVALMAAGCATVSRDNPPGPDEVRIVSSEHRADGHRQAEIEGTVQNFTSSTVYDIVVFGEISGPQGRVWGQGSERIARLHAHETKRFKIKINDVPPGQIQNHRTWLEYNR